MIGIIGTTVLIIEIKEKVRFKPKLMMLIMSLAHIILISMIRIGALTGIETDIIAYHIVITMIISLRNLDLLITRINIMKDMLRLVAVEVMIETLTAVLIRIEVPVLADYKDSGQKSPNIGTGSLPISMITIMITLTKDIQIHRIGDLEIAQ